MKPKEIARLRVKLQIIKIRKHCRENNITQRDIENASGYRLNLSRIFNLKTHEINAATLFMIADLAGFEVVIQYKSPKQ